MNSYRKRQVLMFYHLRKKLRKTLWGVAKGFPLKVKSFQNTATYQKLLGGVPFTPPPPSPHLVPQWGYEFVCTSEG